MQGENGHTHKTNNNSSIILRSELPYQSINEAIIHPYSSILDYIRPIEKNWCLCCLCNIS